MVTTAHQMPSLARDLVFVKLLGAQDRQVRNEGDAQALPGAGLYPKTVQGRMIGIFVMLVEIGFLSVLTATVASHFVRTDTHQDEILDTLRRVEGGLTDLRAEVAALNQG